MDAANVASLFLFAVISLDVFWSWMWFCVWGVVWGFSGLAVWKPPSPSSGTLKFFALALLVCEFEVICRALCKNRKYQIPICTHAYGELTVV